MNKIKYCKFCDKEKPEEDFCKSGGYIKNICRDCQNKKQKKIYQDSKRTKQLEQEIERLRNIINELEKILNKQIEDDKDTQNNKIFFMRQEDKHILNTIKDLKENKDENNRIAK